MNDYIFLCFILGMILFLKSIGSVYMKEDIIDYLHLLQIYNHTEDFLIDVNTMKINHIMLMDIFQYLMNYEIKQLKIL